jgi:hypothetical protein
MTPHGWPRLNTPHPQSKSRPTKAVQRKASRKRKTSSDPEDAELEQGESPRTSPTFEFCKPFGLATYFFLIFLSIFLLSPYLSLCLLILVSSGFPLIRLVFLFFT